MLRRLSLGLVAVVALCAQARAQTLTTMFRFNGIDGAQPIWEPAPDGQGNLYGTTQWGGAPNDCGTVYRFTPGVSRNFETLHRFTCHSDGALPEAGPTYDPSTAMLYGTTIFGGRENDGTIFSYNPATGTFTTLYSFPGGAGGQWPQTQLTLGSDGALYGTVRDWAGSCAPFSQCTAAYRFDPATGSVTSLHVLSAAEGVGAAGHLVFGKAGKLFGVTTDGGTCSNNNDCGTVYRLDPASGAVQVIYNFTDYVEPVGLTVDADKNLYVTTSHGGYRQSGEILKLTPVVGQPYTVSTLFQFGSATAGGYPAAGLTYDSVKQVLYGTTSVGGAGAGGDGVLFQIDPDGGAFTVLHAFVGGSDGATPNDGILVSLGELYGETLGSANGIGTPKYCGNQSPGTCGTLFRYPRF